MLYDPRWERRPIQPPSRRANAFAFFLAAFIPVFIAAYTFAVALDEILLLVVPVAVNLAGLVLTRRSGRPAARPPLIR